MFTNPAKPLKGGTHRRDVLVQIALGVPRPVVFPTKHQLSAVVFPTKHQPSWEETKTSGLL